MDIKINFLVIYLTILTLACIDFTDTSEYQAYWFNKGNKFLNEHKYAEAIEAYNRVLEANSSHKDAWLNKGKALTDSGKFIEALDAYDAAVETDPNFKEAWFNKANTFYRLNKYDKAIETYDKVLEIDPNFTDALYGKGKIFAESGRHNEAIDSYTSFLEKNPQDKRVLVSRGFSYANLERYGDAVSSYDAALIVDSEFDEAWYYKGIALTNQGNYDGALIALNKALIFNPHHKGAWEAQMQLIYSTKEYTTINYVFYNNYSIVIPLGWWMIEIDEELEKYSNNTLFAGGFYAASDNKTDAGVVITVLRSNVSDFDKDAQIFLDSTQKYGLDAGYDIDYLQVNKTIINGKNTLLVEYLEDQGDSIIHSINAHVYCTPEIIVDVNQYTIDPKKFEVFITTFNFIINSIEC